MTEIDTSLAGLASRPSPRRQIALFVLVLVTVVPFMHPRGEQQASRQAFTAAVWDFGSLEITPYADLLGRDRAIRDGVVYSDKAPGQPLLAVPFYGAYRILGGSEPVADPAGTDFGLWWITVWTAGVPLALLAVLMYRWAWQAQSDTALWAALTMTFGSLLVVFGTLLFAHVLAAALGFSMFLLVRSRDAGRVALFAAGALGGLAVLVEYPMALIVAIMVGGALYVHRARAWLVLAGGVPAVALLAFYNASAFGSPTTFSYQWGAFTRVQDEARGALDMFAGPSFDRLAHVLFSERGLLIATPVVAVAVVGLVFMWRRGRRVDAVLAGLAFLSMLAIQASWGNSYAGGAGPRYVIPGLPFLAAPLAVMWSRWRLLTKGLALFSVLTMTLALVTVPQLGSEFYAGFGFWLRELFTGNTAPTVYTVAFGAWGWLLHVATVGLALTLLLRTPGDDGPGPTTLVEDVVSGVGALADRRARGS